MADQLLLDASQAKEGLACVSLEGSVNLTTVPRVRHRLLGCAKKRETKEMSLDMVKVTQLDTAGVALLVELWRCLGRRGGKLRLSGLSDHAKRFLHLAGVDQILTIEDDAGGATC